MENEKLKMVSSAFNMLVLVMLGGFLSFVTMTGYIKSSGVLREGIGILFSIAFVCVLFFLLAAIYFSIISFLVTKLIFLQRYKFIVYIVIAILAFAIYYFVILPAPACVGYYCPSL